MGSEYPHYIGHRKRLRERFLKAGIEALADYEAVELLLTLAVPRSDVKQPAKDLIARFGNLKGILDAPLEELRQTAGIGEVTAAALQLIKAAASLYLKQSAEATEPAATVESLSDYWRARIGAMANEVFEVAYLDSGSRLLHDGTERLQEGTVDRSVVYPRRIVEGALRKGAAALVLGHNHPSGDVSPSEADKLLTRAIILAAETVQLRIVDHLIVCPGRSFSFRKAGLL